MSDDGGAEGFFMFVADKPKDLSAGMLYAARWKQRNTKPIEAEIRWVNLGHANNAEIDELINHFAPDWPVETITIVDRNVLRLGIYELKFSENVPSKVAINEAIELAKGFGGEASGRFVNGVLGAIYKDMIAKGEEKEVDKLPPKKERKEEKEEVTEESENVESNS